MTSRGLLALTLGLTVLINFARPVRGCGPNFIEPIFVFENSPDLPFTEYVRGNIGIVRPGFGRKTLFIAYRYLNGGSFTADEQEGLVAALRGDGPEDDGTEALKAWVAARKEIAVAEEKLPEIYTERQYGGYDFFPNCTKNAFEVATATLKDRANSYGGEDPNVRAWLAAQDQVFQNCQSGGAIPNELGPESPVWLRKDRDYQIAAALLYSLNFDEARARFEKIAADPESTWQQTAEYLVGRTLIRQASLTEDEKTKRELYDRVEHHLQILSARRGKFSRAAQALLGLIKYRIHPEERVRELAAILSNQSASENLKQDLIDYVWLIDKFEDLILKEEERKRKKEEVEQQKQVSNEAPYQNEIRERYQAVQRGERILLNFTPKMADGKPDFTRYIFRDFKPDTGWAEVLQAFEGAIGRNLTPEEQKELNQKYTTALDYRKYLVSPNRKYGGGGLTQYEGCFYDCGNLTLDLIPAFLRDDLSDWIFSLQSKDRNAYGHALAEWRETGSAAWLVVAISKAEKTSPRLDRLMRDAEKIDRSSPAFLTAAYNLVRLKIALGRKAEARKMLEEITSSDFESFPISARNQFLAQRMQLAESLNEFLRFAQRRVVAFYNEGALGKMSDLVRIDKEDWNPQYHDKNKEQYEQEIDEFYAERLPWDDRVTFDETTIDILNWHFPLEVLRQAARNPELPDYLRRQLVLAIWTRAVLLENEAVAQSIAPDVIKFAPEMRSVFEQYLNANTPKEKEYAALSVLLKFPSLSPLITGGIPEFTTTEKSEYDFESSWWCTPSETEYTGDGNEVPKVVPKPGFLTVEELEQARKERAALIAIGDGKSYIGKRVLEWAQNSPKDPRIPEALFIAAKANESYKYGCGGWENDKETQAEAVSILVANYPNSPWTAKLLKPADQ
jgi:hypothetical protein